MSTAAIAPVFIHASVKRRKNVWYSARDGNWSDPKTWLSNAGKRWSFPGQSVANPIFPAVGDDVYINHVVTVNVSVLVVNNLYVVGSLLFDTGARVLTLRGDIQATGTVNMSGAAHDLQLAGAFNFINSTLFNPGTNATVTYNRIGDQEVMDLSYKNLTITGDGIKYAANHLIVGLHLYIGSQYTTNQNPILDLRSFNLTVTTTTYIALGNSGVFRKTGSGTCIFMGAVTINRSFSGTFVLRNTIEITNPSVVLEFRNGITYDDSNGNPLLQDFGSCLIKFTTNNQSINAFNAFSNITLDADILIDNVELTLSNTASNLTLSLGNSITGSTGSSKLINKGTLNFTTQIAAGNSMTTGTWDFTTFANTIGYAGNYTTTIPSYFTNFWNVTISGTGTKSLGANTTLAGNLVFGNGGVLEAAAYNLTVAGTVSQSFASSFLKSGSGSLIFIGQYTQTFVTGIVFKLTGNPTVEFRGGYTFYAFQGTNFDSGTGQWSFTTNNQSIFNGGDAISTIYQYNGSMRVVGAISVTLSSSGSASAPMYINQSLDGTVAGSTWNNSAAIYFNNPSFPSPMATFGIFDRMSSSSSIVGYTFNGAFTLPYSTYQGLVIGGTGTKKPMGNLDISTSFFGMIGSTFDIDIYNLSIGTTSSVTGSLISGPGNVLFVGLITLGGTGSLIDFSAGNPTVEFRAGINIGSSGATLNFGSGTKTFSTNNQTILATSGIISITVQNNWIISGAISVTNTTTLSLGSINGNNANSKFDNRGTVNYLSSTMPMITGLLDCNASANTFKYNGTLAQAVKGGAYRTMEFGGSGVKQLQGNVTNTARTTTGSATIDLNGFTLTP